MTPDTQALTAEIRQLAAAKDMEPIDLLRFWLARDKTETELRLSKHERKLRLA